MREAGTLSAPGRSITIPAALMQRIAEQGRRAAPVEACGYCAGMGCEVRELLPLRNADQSAEHFSLDPKEQFDALRAARRKDLLLIAVYHSHPVTPARMSAEDIRLANDPTMIYLIYSLASDELKGFSVDEAKRVQPVAVSVTPG